LNDGDHQPAQHYSEIPLSPTGSAALLGNVFLPLGTLQAFLEVDEMINKYDEHPAKSPKFVARMHWAKQCGQNVVAGEWSAGRN
jgi:hypothetical protein